MIPILDLYHPEAYHPTHEFLSKCKTNLHNKDIVIPISLQGEAKTLTQTIAFCAPILSLLKQTNPLARRPRIILQTPPLTNTSKEDVLAIKMLHWTLVKFVNHFSKRFSPHIIITTSLVPLLISKKIKKILLKKLSEKKQGQT